MNNKPGWISYHFKLFYIDTIGSKESIWNWWTKSIKVTAGLVFIP